MRTDILKTVESQSFYNHTKLSKSMTTIGAEGINRIATHEMWHMEHYYISDIKAIYR